MEQSESSVALAEAALAQAEGAIALAEADLARANAELARLRAGARPEEIAMYEAQLAQAEATYLQPRTSYDELAKHDVGGRERLSEDPVLVVQRRVPGFQHEVEVAPAAAAPVPVSGFGQPPAARRPVRRRSPRDSRRRNRQRWQRPPVPPCASS